MLFSEPKIPQSVLLYTRRRLSLLFQCSSASRKFLNQNARTMGFDGNRFQCSSASRKFLNQYVFFPKQRDFEVSVLFSEPKIPQSAKKRVLKSFAPDVSVLFSEPKIPQSQGAHTMCIRQKTVSVLFSEPKIPQFLTRIRISLLTQLIVSVLFSEPKIPQSGVCVGFSRV